MWLALEPQAPAFERLATGLPATYGKRSLGVAIPSRLLLRRFKPDRTSAPPLQSVCPRRSPWPGWALHPRWVPVSYPVYA